MCAVPPEISLAETEAFAETIRPELERRISEMAATLPAHERALWLKHRRALLIGFARTTAAANLRRRMELDLCVAGGRAYGWQIDVRRLFHPPRQRPQEGADAHDPDR